ncbi:MAG: hypothetical protein ABJC12_10020 [Saprospiraceae bacterium]
MMHDTLSMDQIMIFLCGVFSLGFAIFHTQFWRLFNWKEDLEHLTAPNKAIMQISNMRLIYLFVFVALICFIFPKELLSTSLGTFFLAGMSLFWLGRTIEQFVFIRIEHPMVHFLTYLFIIGTLLFAIPILI